MRRTVRVPLRVQHSPPFERGACPAPPAWCRMAATDFPGKLHARGDKNDAHRAAGSRVGVPDFAGVAAGLPGRGRRLVGRRRGTDPVRPGSGRASPSSRPARPGGLRGELRAVPWPASERRPVRAAREGPGVQGALARSVRRGPVGGALQADAAGKSGQSREPRLYRRRGLPAARERREGRRHRVRRSPASLPPPRPSTTATAPRACCLRAPRQRGCDLPRRHRRTERRCSASSRRSRMRCCATHPPPTG